MKLNIEQHLKESNTCHSALSNVSDEIADASTLLGQSKNE